MSEIEITIRLLLSCFFGGVVGFIRERDRKAAGLRTHIMVAVGSTLFTLVSIYMAMTFVNVDASRVAAAVVTGIGFLCAGAIIRDGGSVRGLTTAASVWAVSAIGIAVGCGMYFTASVATFIAFIVLEGLSRVERKYISPDKGKTL
jgi:putative Mg2+ transporter-C (MgtC) family protein